MEIQISIHNLYGESIHKPVYLYVRILLSASFLNCSYNFFIHIYLYKSLCLILFCMNKDKSIQVYLD